MPVSPEAEEAEAGYHVNLPDFEGPLDLLLHLVKKHELDIFHIPIAFITERYLQMLAAMQVLNMDIAGEYLLMAATLAHIKSRELLPREATQEQEADADDDGIDPRQALVKRLLEYQKYKEAAQHLAGRPVVGRNVWIRGAEATAVVGGAIDTTAPLQEVPVFDLIESLARILERARVELTHDVTLDRLSLADAINELTERLLREDTFTFESCFAWLDTVDGVINLRGRVVITFMAILEMAKLRLMHLYQAQPTGSIYLARAEGLKPPEPEKSPPAEPAEDGEGERGTSSGYCRGSWRASVPSAIAS